jgi:hypothetical protein
VIELGFVRAQAHLDVAQALAPGELSEGHAQKLIETREALGVAVAIVPGHRATKGVQRQVLHELRENISTLMHDGIPLVVVPPSVAQMPFKSMTGPRRELPQFLQSLANHLRTTSPDSTGLAKESGQRKARLRRRSADADCAALLPLGARRRTRCVR